MADSTQSSPSLRPDWKDRICDENGLIRDHQTREDYDAIRQKTKDVLLEAYRSKIKEESEAEGVTLSDREVDIKIQDRADQKSAECVDSMDWEKHQIARKDPDPNAPGRIRIEHDFSRDATWDKVSRNEMNRDVNKGVFPSLKSNDINYVVLGDKDKSFDSDKTHNYFALPRAKQGDADVDATDVKNDRSDYRIVYGLQKDEVGKGPQFGLRDDCSGGTWTVKNEQGEPRYYRCEGGGQQGVIIQGGEHFKADREKDHINAYNRRTGKDEEVKLRPKNPEAEKSREQSRDEPTAETKREPKVESEAKVQPKPEEKSEPKSADASQEKSQRELDRETKYGLQGKSRSAEIGKDGKSLGSEGHSESAKGDGGKE